MLNWLGHILKREGENEHWDGLLKVGGQEEDQELLGEGQSRKSKTELGGRAGKQPKRLHKTESVGQTAWRPCAATGAIRLDDDDDDDLTNFSVSWEIDYQWSPTKNTGLQA